MRLPFITRAHHEQIVAGMKKQLEGCAKLLYPQGVPEEFQLLLGIKIEGQAVAKVEPERELTDDEKAVAEMKAEQARDLAELKWIKRSRPSLLGQAMARHMEKWGSRQAIVATKAAPLETPATKLFADAAREALKQTPDA